MIEVCVTVNYKDRNYQKCHCEQRYDLDKIEQLAEEQVKKQWGFKLNYLKNEVIC